MKKILYSIATVVAMSGFSSCTDFLTQDVLGTESLDQYFKNPDQVDQYVKGCYFQISKGGDWWQVENPWLLTDMTTDDMWDGNTDQDDGYAMTTHFYPTGQDQGILKNFWGARYQGIATTNLGLERIAEVDFIDEDLQRRYIAELRFLRAFFYFDLVRFFGGVPLITNYEAHVLITPRNTLEECYAWIEDELKAAAEDLPINYPDVEVGHVTKGAALGILGKAQLYQAKWAEAKTTLKSVIDLGVYKLMDNYGDVWSSKHNNNEESLFETQHMYSAEEALGSSLTVVTGVRNGVGDGWAWGQPSSDLENAFIAMGDTERLKWSIIKTTCTEIPGEDNFQEFIDNNSKIKDSWASYAKDFGWTDETYSTTFVIDPSIHKSSRNVRKYFVPTQDRPAVYNVHQIPLNIRILRYADILLMYAEACNETGDDPNAQNALNQVRARVHLDPVTVSGSALRDAIRAERRLELCFEQCRLFDLRRWDMSDGRKMMEHVFGPNGTFVQYNLGPDADMYEVWNQIESSDKGIRFDPHRDLLYPIPLYELQHSNGVITQNPGW